MNLKNLKYLPVIIFILILSQYSVSRAEENGSDSPKKSLSPIFGYNPTDKFILGGAYFIIQDKTPGFYLGTQVMGTLKSGYALMVDYKKWNRTPFLYELTAGFSNFSYAYYGEGNNTKAEDEITIDANNYSFKPVIKYSFSRVFSTGAFVDLRARKEKSVKNIPGIRMFPDETTMGLGINLAYDLRDNSFSSQNGKYMEMTFFYIPENLSKKTNINDFWQSEVDLRYFKTLKFKYTLASHLRGGYTEGDPTYLFRYSGGGSRELRGYFANRFRGKKYYLAQEELRISLTRVISLVFFTDAGDITDSKFSSIKTTCGTGLRFGLPPDYIMKLRLDLGIAKDQSGMFIEFGEVF